MERIKKAIVKKGNSFHICVCKSPYTEKDIITDGLLYEDRLKLRYHNEQQ